MLAKSLCVPQTMNGKVTSEMATAWVQYWRPQQLELARRNAGDGEPLGHTAGEQFGTVVPGDVVYVLGRSGTSLLLVGRLIVDEILDQAEAEARFEGEVYQATVHLVAHGTARRLDRLIPIAVAVRLRRASGEPLVDADGNASGDRLQAVGSLEPASAALLDEVLDPDDDRDDVLVSVAGLPEGAPIEGKHRAIERNRGVHDAALRVHGHECMVCGFDFERRYGPRGAGFAEVHHLTPLASLRGEVVVTNPLTDVAVLCANCHRMVHQGDDVPIAIDVLRDELIGA